MHLFLLVAVFVHVNVARLHHHPHQLIAPAKITSGQVKSLATNESNNLKSSLPYNNSYNKHQSGRHVCTTERNVIVPVKIKEAYCKPLYQKYIERCSNNQLCTGVRLIYETAYRDVTVTRTTNHVTYSCCPGWGQTNNRSYGCNKPQCSIKCHNGGSCARPDLCKCLKGFTGRYCEFDIDECKDEKPCDQICYNTIGSYRCECRETFSLQSDGQSCRKKGGDGSALEAKDLEYELLDKRLFTLETLLATKHLNMPFPFSNKTQHAAYNLENILTDATSLKTKLQELEEYRNDLYILKAKIKQLETKTNKMDKMLT